ncbi:MAG: hypothetical protein ABJA67_14185 [Chthonomonadales bacterium]
MINSATGQWERMSSGGRVIVFDTAEIAWNWLPLLGGGREYRLDRQKGEIWFLELKPGHPNRAKLISPYDPGESYPWKRHVIWTEWWSG